ncbi:MAG: exosortase/archaeosortase family protein [Nanoarchaeota archaeon]|nr:exosortase/archaeosortase family protein [Nanoarchaeota archaeon]
MTRILKNLENTKKSYENYRNTIQKKYVKKWNAIIFLTTLILLATPLYLIMESNFSLFWFEKLFSTSVSTTLIIQGINVNETIGYENNGLKMPVLEIEGLEKQVGIGRACTGYRSILALFALTFSVPKIKFSKKVKAIIKFLPVMIIINYLRLYTTILLGILFGDNVFNFVHTFLWREGLIIIILLLWSYWLNSQKKHRHKVSPL